MLGRIACLVLSKIIRLGSSERNWKELKRVKTPTKNWLKTDKLEKLTTLVGHHCGAKSKRRRARLARAGKFCTEDDFESLNFLESTTQPCLEKPNQSGSYEHGG